MHVIEVKDARIPALGLGTWELRGEACRQAVREALDLGYRHLDTAQMYDNEAEVGAALADSGVPREAVFLTTKLWMDRLAPAAVPGALEDSLRRLKSDYVDLLLIHWPEPGEPLAGTLDAMAALRERGLVRHLGVSNFTSALLDQAAASHGALLVCNQVEYHPLLSQKAVLAGLARHDMALTAYCPLARGQAAERAAVREIAERHGRSPTQVVLRWLVQQPRVAAIPKSSRRAHLADNLAVFEFALSPAEMDAISALAEGRRLVDPAWAPAWDPA